MQSGFSHISEHVMDHVIRQLRKEDLQKGHCFMISDSRLPADQAYIEYPDGSIKVEKITKNGTAASRQVVRTASAEEVAHLKKNHFVFH